MTVEELAKKLEGKKWQQMVGILNKYSLELYTDALGQAQKAVDNTWRNINKVENMQNPDTGYEDTTEKFG